MQKKCLFTCSPSSSPVRDGAAVMSVQRARSNKSFSPNLVALSATDGLERATETVQRAALRPANDRKFIYSKTAPR